MVEWYMTNGSMVTVAQTPGSCLWLRLYSKQQQVLSIGPIEITGAVKSIIDHLFLLYFPLLFVGSSAPVLTVVNGTTRTITSNQSVTIEVQVQDNDAGDTFTVRAAPPNSGQNSDCFMIAGTTVTVMGNLVNCDVA